MTGKHWHIRAAGRGRCRVSTTSAGATASVHGTHCAKFMRMRLGGRFTALSRQSPWVSQTAPPLGEGGIVRSGFRWVHPIMPPAVGTTRGVLRQVAAGGGGCGQPDIASAVTVTGPSSQQQAVWCPHFTAFLPCQCQAAWRDTLASERHLVREAAVPKLCRLKVLL